MKTVKKQLLLFAVLSLFAINTCKAQITISEMETTATNDNAILDIQSTTKGILIPRMKFAERVSIASNPEDIGLLVFQTDSIIGFYYCNGTMWSYLSETAPIQLPALAKVATSGNYEDLIGKPVLFSGVYDSLKNKPVIPQLSTTMPYDSVTNKPAIPISLSELLSDENNRTITDIERQAWNNKSSFSGDYEDLQNKPNIPKVPTTMSYDSILNPPTIPTALSQLSQDTFYRTVTDIEKSMWNNKSDFTGDYNDLCNKPTMERGNWAPIVNGATLNINSARYARIGNFVHVQLNGKVASCSNGSALFQITGIPFLSLLAENITAVKSIITTTGGSTTISHSGFMNSSFIYFVGTTGTLLTNSQIGQFFISVEFEID